MESILKIFDDLKIQDNNLSKTLVEDYNVSTETIKEIISKDNIEDLSDPDKICEENEYYYLQKFMTFYIIKVKDIKLASLITYFNNFYYNLSPTNIIETNHVIKIDFQKINSTCVFIPFKYKILFYLKPIDILHITQQIDILYFHQIILDYFRCRFLFSSNYFYELFQFRPPFYAFIDHNTGVFLFKKDFDYLNHDEKFKYELDNILEDEYVNCQLCCDLFLKYLTI